MTLLRPNRRPRKSEAVTAGETVYLAGQIPHSLTADITIQTREGLAEIDAVLAQLGGGKSDLVSVQVWLSDMAVFSGMNSVWDGWVDTTNPPARATCGVDLARPEMRVEMIAIARLIGAVESHPSER